MMSRNAFIDRLIRVIFYSDLHGTRFMLGLAEIIWAITLLWPGNTFDRPTYTVMSHVMTEDVWGFLFLVSGVTQFLIILTGDYHSKFPVFFAGWNSTMWTFVVISMYLSVSPPPAAISGELALAFGASWIFIRSGVCTIGRRSTDYGT